MSKITLNHERKKQYYSKVEIFINLANLTRNMTTALTATSRTLGEDLASKIVAAHIEEQRTKLEGKIDVLLMDPKPSDYKDILELTSFAPDVKQKVYSLMKGDLDKLTKQELARQVVLRSSALESQLEEYIKGVYSVGDRHQDARIPAHLAFAAEHHFLQQAVDSGYLGIQVLRETGQDPQLSKDSLSFLKELEFFKDTAIQLDGVKLAIEERQRYAITYVPSTFKRIVQRLETVLKYTQYREPLGRHECDYLNKENIGVLGRTIIAQARNFLDDQALLHEYLQMVCQVLDSGKYPGDHETARRNHQHFADTVTYVQLLSKIPEKVPVKVKKAFYEFVGNTVSVSSDKKNSEQHPLANHFFMTLSLANHLHHYEGGIHEGDGKEAMVTQVIQSLYRLEKKQKLSSLDRTFPAQYYRAVLALPAPSVATYEKLLETGLSENTQFGIASMEPLQKLLQTSPPPAVEILYATAIRTLRESNWDYAMQMLHNKTRVSQRVLELSERGLQLKLLPGGKDEGGTQNVP